ncbi:hypothetical protein Pint_27706 [Pistacia integerrima]|uniref:Uncharacterized protein n=1 Tax=Pistacia integerrima TaxID=434235 RepID=A0ACC0YUT0_9ROSI|nr:hypothetical protein Pint_27706 [Pistacia integerrima]
MICRHEIVGEVTEVGGKVTKVKVGVGCLVGACHSCDNCVNDLENYCPKWTLTYNSINTDGTITYGGCHGYIGWYYRYGVCSPSTFAIAQSIEVQWKAYYGRKTVAGSIIGEMKETQEMVDFAAKHNITADIEVISMDYVNTAMERLGKADVRYRFVIDIGNTLAATKL